jgi:hypothetical protein
MESMGPSSEQKLGAYCETSPYSVPDLNRSIQYISTTRHSLLVPSYLFSISAYVFKVVGRVLQGAGHGEVSTALHADMRDNRQETRN